MIDDRRYVIGSALGLIVASAILSAILIWFADFGGATALKGGQQPPSASSPVGSAEKVSPAGEGATVTFNPPRPEDAPQEIRGAVLLGASILTDTVHALPSNVGNKLNCSNCHFDAGGTQGGKNGGISLVGVSATYPKYRDRQKFAVALVARIND